MEFLHSDLIKANLQLDIVNTRVDELMKLRELITDPSFGAQDFLSMMEKEHNALLYGAELAKPDKLGFETRKC